MGDAASFVCCQKHDILLIMEGHGGLLDNLSLLPGSCAPPAGLAARPLWLACSAVASCTHEGVSRLPQDADGASKSETKGRELTCA